MLGAAVVVLLVLLAQGGSDDANQVASPQSTPTQDPLDPSAFFLDITSPVEAESISELATLTVAGRTRVDAVVSVNDVITAPDDEGRFAVELALEVGPNVIEVVASVESGEELSEVLAVIYLPE